MRGGFGGGATPPTGGLGGRTPQKLGLSNKTESNTISLNENYTSNLNPPLSSPF
ncbi:hypothetical protein NIES298_00730 [Microcystis aeruginosa NIES-298]|nr:hypothetical protein NIES298_00730 [Microcystis aeruginosa NIES-298]